MRGTEIVQVGRGRERGRERIPSRLLTVSLELGLRKQRDHDLSQNEELAS